MKALVVLKNFETFVLEAPGEEDPVNVLAEDTIIGGINESGNEWFTPLANVWTVEVFKEDREHDLTRKRTYYSQKGM